jgi:uncharacterized protein YqgV (UPF0045/DUF77 family)
MRRLARAALPRLLPVAQRLPIPRRARVNLLHNVCVDQELTQHLTDMETRIDGRMQTTESRIEGKMQIMETRIDDRMQAMEARIEGQMQSMETRIEGKMQAIEIRIGDRIDETMRRMQTELLRGIAAFSEAITIRMRKIEVD